MLAIHVGHRYAQAANRRWGRSGPMWEGRYKAWRGPACVSIRPSSPLEHMYAAVAIQAALAHRERTGEGQSIDCSLFDSAVAMMATMSHNYLITGTPPSRIGNAHQNIVPYEVFACADGHLILAVGNDAQFAKFCAVAGKPEWSADPRFAKNAGRVRHRDVLVPLIAAVVRERPQRAWLDALEPLGVPCGPINRMYALVSSFSSFGK